jgi:hypothetical protein
MKLVITIWAWLLRKLFRKIVPQNLKIRSAQGRADDKNHVTILMALFSKMFQEK